MDILFLGLTCSIKSMVTDHAENVAGKGKGNTMKKITDKMRLDWLTKNNESMFCTIGGGSISFEIYFMNKCFEFDTPRKAIDAAIKAEKRKA